MTATHPLADALVVVPTYNESENLAELVTSIAAVAPQTDILVVDDNSPDGTGRIADALATTRRVAVIHRPKKAGIGRAYVAGFRWALARSYRLVFAMDADLSHDPADLIRLAQAAADADLVIGSRYVVGGSLANWGIHRRILSRGASRYVRAITGMPVLDPTSGFKCFRREALASLDLGRLRSEGYSFQIETTHETWRLGRRVHEVPIRFTERRHNHSKMTVGIVGEACAMAWRLWARNGFRRSPGADSG